MDWILMLMIAAVGGASTYLMIELFRWGYNEENKDK